LTYCDGENKVPVLAELDALNESADEVQLDPVESLTAAHRVDGHAHVLCDRHKHSQVDVGVDRYHFRVINGGGRLQHSELNVEACVAPGGASSVVASALDDVPNADRAGLVACYDRLVVFGAVDRSDDACQAVDSKVFSLQIQRVDVHNRELRSEQSRNSHVFLVLERKL